MTHEMSKMTIRLRCHLRHLYATYMQCLLAAKDFLKRIVTLNYHWAV